MKPWRYTGLLALAFGTADLASGQELRFTDVSKAAGLVLQHRSKHPNKDIAASRPGFQNVFASGYYSDIQDLAFVDADGDGNLDIFLLNYPHSRWSRLWLGDGKGGFTEVADDRYVVTWKEADSLTGLNPPRACRRILAYDFRGQGAQDVLLTCGGFHPSLRLRCLPGAAAGKQPVLKVFGTAFWCDGGTALLSDVDGDGIVDFLLGPYTTTGPRAGGNVLCCGTLPVYERSAARGEGEALQNRSRLRFEVEPERTAIAVPVGDHAIAADFHGDGRVDVLARGSAGVHLMRNLGNRRFLDVTEEAGLGQMPAGGPVAVADFNNDGLLDIVCGMRLYLNQGGGKFKDATAGSGLTAGKAEATWSAGTATVADFNNDGLPDLLVCDGNVNRLYLNLGGGKFKDVTKESGLLETVKGESSNAAGDFDNDGRVDLLVTTADRGPGLFRNLSPNKNHWLKLKLRGPRGNPEAAGAQVTVYADGKLGDKKSILGYQERILATEFKVPCPLHFGLGTHSKCDLRVVFPGGRVVEQRQVAADGVVTISEKEAP